MLTAYFEIPSLNRAIRGTIIIFHTVSLWLHSPLFPYRAKRWAMNPMSLKLLFNGFRYGKLCNLALYFFSCLCLWRWWFWPKSVLASYRVVALRAEPAELSLTSTSVLSLYDFHPGDLVGGRPEIEYEWRLCPFSLGSVTQYECLLDELILKSNSSMEDMSETQGEEVDFEVEEIDDRMGERPAANATLTAPRAI